MSNDVQRHLITARSAFSIKDERYSLDYSGDFHDFRQLQFSAQVNPHKRSDRGASRTDR
jgi:hypothetical protein